MPKTKNDSLAVDDVVKAAKRRKLEYADNNRQRDVLVLHQDGEADDYGLLIAIAKYLNNYADIVVVSSVGSSWIRYGKYEEDTESTKIAEQELELREDMAKTIFADVNNVTFLKGASDKSEVPQQLVDTLNKYTAQGRHVDVINSASWRGIQTYFASLQANSAGKVRVFATGGANAMWVFDDRNPETKQDNFENFYSSVAAASSSIDATDPFKVVGASNKVIPEHMPLTSLLYGEKKLDGEAGKKLLHILEENNQGARQKIAGNTVAYCFDFINTRVKDLKHKISKLESKIAEETDGASKDKDILQSQLTTEQQNLSFLEAEAAKPETRQALEQIMRDFLSSCQAIYNDPRILDQQTLRI